MSDRNNNILYKLASRSSECLNADVEVTGQTKGVIRGYRIGSTMTKIIAMTNIVWKDSNQIAFLPSDTGLEIIAHFGQQISSKKSCRHNWNEHKIKEKYGTLVPLQLQPDKHHIIIVRAIYCRK